MIAKPYSGQYLDLLLDTISRNGLKPEKIFSTENWSEVARRIYEKNVKLYGNSFKIGLEGHIKLVNSFFGNRAAVLLLGPDCSDTEKSLQETLCLTQQVKKELRGQTPGGPDLTDIVVMMNLEKLDGNHDVSSVAPTGIIGVQKEDGEFRPISKVKGIWDFYYFKYVHAPDSIDDLQEELETLNDLGVLDDKNEVSFEDFVVMAKLKTLVPPKLFR